MIGKVKIVAIAKDEGAYLPEWIFHHFYFGFDSIDIYINGTSDNSLAVIEKAAKKIDINIINADKYRDISKSNFQQYVYKLALKNIDKSKFSHIAFLDIDEFWVPSDFNSNIKSFLVKNDKFDVSVFNWVIHLDEEDFSLCFKESLAVVNNKHVKSVMKIGKEMTPTAHSALGNLTYGDCDGNEVFSDHPGKAHNIVPDDCQLKAFILHRAYRSQKEYVSLLGKGRLRGDLFKNNRYGYTNSIKSKYKLTLDGDKISEYYEDYSSFMSECDLLVEQEFSREFVMKRYDKVIQLAYGSLSYNDIQSLIIAFKNVKIAEVEKVLCLLKTKILKNKIFQIGFNKCGTASIFHYMKSNNYKAIHWDNGKISTTMQDNYRQGKPLLTGYEDYQVFTDMEHREPDKSAFYAYQKYFKELDKQYPEATFILNTRNIDKWIASRIKHPGYLEKTMIATGLDKESVINIWRQHFVEHVDDVKSYFLGKNNLITFDLDNDSQEKLYYELTKCGFTLKNKKLPHTHKTKTTLSQKQENVNTIRNIALFFEKSDLTTARDLMKIANKLRPEGKFIQEKLDEYEKLLN